MAVLNKPKLSGVYVKISERGRKRKSVNFTLHGVPSSKVERALRSLANDVSVSGGGGGREREASTAS